MIEEYIDGIYYTDEDNAEKIKAEIMKALQHYRKSLELK